MNDALYHHGIKGQKWGVRRFQNKDGTLTDEGRRRAMYRRRTINANLTRAAVNDILKSLDKEELDKVLAGDSEYLTAEQGSSVIKRFLHYEKNTPISFFDMLDDGDTINVVLATRSGDDYRGKGIATNLAKKAVKYGTKTGKKMVWGVREDNAASIRVAKKNGFKLEKNSRSKDKDGNIWVNYIR